GHCRRGALCLARGPRGGATRGFAAEYHARKAHRRVKPAPGADFSDPPPPQEFTITAIIVNFGRESPARWTAPPLSPAQVSRGISCPPGALLGLLAGLRAMSTSAGLFLSPA